MAFINVILLAAMAIGMLGVLISLFSGLAAMGGKSDASRQKSNLFMRMRVGFQLLTLVSVVLLVVLNFSTF
jgi:hypothetical protein